MSKIKYRIIDDVLEYEQFDDLRGHLTSQQFPWFFSGDVAYDPKGIVAEGDRESFEAIRTEKELDWSFYFRHMFYTDNGVATTDINWMKIQPLIEKLGVKSLMRVKANAYTRTPEILHHKDHSDFPFEHKGALFYINDCDGLTVLEDGTEVKSVANRLLLFDSSKPHHSTTTTNATRRINLNFNYF